MSTEQSFLDAIIANPNDDSLRLIFADWLEEQGSPRGEFIRVQCELARSNKDDPTHSNLKSRERRLLKKHSWDWVSELPDPMGSPVFRRGFIEHCRLAVTIFVKNWESIFRITPLQSVHFYFGEGRLGTLGETPGLDRVTSMSFGYNGLDCTDFDELLSSPRLSSLKNLRVDWPAIGPDFSDTLTKSRVLSKLQSLHLAGSHLDESQFGVSSIEPICQLGSELVELDLRNVGLTDNAARAIMREGCLERLKRLTLGGQHLSDETLRLLANSPKLQQLESLSIASPSLNAGEAQQLTTTNYRNQNARLIFRCGTPRSVHTPGRLWRVVQMRADERFSHWPDV